MILGLGESEKQFKNAMEAAGADMSVVNSWLKLYQKTKKNSVNVTNKYYVVKANLNKLLSDLKEIEQLIISDEQDPAVKKKIGSLIRDCKSMKNEFDDEFLINKDDKDFHMTLESVIKLGTEFCVNRSCGDHIIFQSEVENLIHLAEEGASREKPDLFARYMDKVTNHMISTIIKRLRDTLSKYVTITITDITGIIPEFIYYIRWAEYIEKMQAEGLKFSRAVVSVTTHACGIYNMKLIPVVSEEHETIVTNDLDFDDEHCVYILIMPVLQALPFFLQDLL